MKKLPIRQGDVLLAPVSKVPSGAIEIPPTDSRKVILALGEATGHHHRVDDVVRESPRARLWEAAGERFLQVLTRSELAHEEHSAPLLEPGTYQLPIQVSVTTANQPRRVVD